ncbi:MAG: YgjV family protein [Streptococcus gallolyticus]|nr:YgjV family protein [Streptococcus gallolyticus]
MMLIANIIGWIATGFRSAGMLCKSADLVKYLVSIGNLCWMINGIMTKNTPLIASNAICLVIMGVDIIKKRTGSKKNKA